MAFDCQDLWALILSKVSARVNKLSFETWFSPTRAVRYENDVLLVEVPSRFFCDWLTEHYLSMLSEYGKELTSPSFSIRFSISQDTPSKPNFTMEPAARKSEPPSASVFDAPTIFDRKQGGVVLNPKYTFGTFVVGNSNRFAHAASLAVADAPAKSYNPLFIYGGVGLGKTHLLHAIGNHINQLSPDKRVVYVSSETFMNEMISSIGAGTMRAFRDRFRTVDVLLIDDIQFLVGKESTQEEFFHTFNDLYNLHKQIVATSDSHPKEISLEERLRSRFEWGLVADIQSPDFEMRKAILRQMADSEKVEIPNEVMDYLANQIKSNVRELEGSLTRVIAYSSLTKATVNLDLVREVLRDLFVEDSRPITIDLITETVAKEFNLKVSDLKAKKRTAMIVLPRQISMYLARELTDFSLPEIGRFFGGKDHTTVIYGYDKIKDKLTHDEKLRYTVQRLVSQLKETNYS